MPIPQVAIVGRPNVGKSSLLNALAERRISIVQDMPGVTRDRISTHIALDGRYIELVDTGGYGVVDVDALTEHIHAQIELAMARANLVLFVVDAGDGLTSADEQIAQLLRRRGLQVLLVANKAENQRRQLNAAEFARLGFGEALAVSALHGDNLDALRAALASRLDLSAAPTTLPDPEMLVAIVGKRNAGKSTLVNAVAELYGQAPDRVIVSEVPGTTRDSVDVRFEKDGQALVVIDTAGVRKKRYTAQSDIEFYSFHRAQRSIRRADVVIHLIDGSIPVSEPDKKLADYIMQQFKPVVLVVNKWDLVRAKVAEQRGDENVDDAALMDEYREYFESELRLLDFCPIAFITASESRKVQSVLDLAGKLFKEASLRVSTGQLNRAVRQALSERQPSTPSGRKAKVFYATQTDVCPPTLVLFVNREEYFDATYRRFLINRFRELLPYDEVPIRLHIRARQQRGEKSLEERGEEELAELDGDTPADKRRGKTGTKSSTGKAPPSVRHASSRAHGKKQPNPLPKRKPTAPRGNLRRRRKT